MTGDEQDPTARLSRAEVEIPASPEDVWQAIATDAGNAAWMFAAEIEPAEGGEMVIHREPFGGDTTARVTAWEPLHRFAFEEPVEDPDRPAAPPLATEFLVEARDQGTCVVRVVCGFPRDGEGWEDLVEGAGAGWQMSLIVLRSYLTHFAGQTAARLDATAHLGRPLAHRAETSAILMDLLGLTGLAAGDAFRTRKDAPALSGVVEYASEGYILLRATEPYPALFAISSFPMESAALSVNILGRLYGADAGVAARDKARWRSWLSDQATALTTT